MMPKKLAPAKAGVADFSDKIMSKIKENHERFPFNLGEKLKPCPSSEFAVSRPNLPVFPGTGNSGIHA
jgi:hypothetical protein